MHWYEDEKGRRQILRSIVCLTNVYLQPLFRFEVIIALVAVVLTDRVGGLRKGDDRYYEAVKGQEEANQGMHLFPLCRNRWKTLSLIYHSEWTPSGGGGRKRRRNRGGRGREVGRGRRRRRRGRRRRWGRRRRSDVRKLSDGRSKMRSRRKERALKEFFK